ncbi:MAG: methyltransferase [Kofleriaceae bacterium]|nr:methyltransferase [Kofleriaceae bacterium]
MKAPGLFCVLLGCIVAMQPACKDAPSQPTQVGSTNGTGSAGLPDDTDREQTRYDQDRRPDLIVAAAGIKPGDTVADVGAGSGLLTLHLARAVSNGKVVATDIDRAVLDLLVARLRKAGVPDVVETRIVSADMPGLEAGAYNVILLAEVDHYFPDRVAWLTAAQKALAPGGRIVISNRVHHRVGAMDAAKKAGLIRMSQITPVPSHFVAVFTAGKNQ